MRVELSGVESIYEAEEVKYVAEEKEVSFQPQRASSPVISEERVIEIQVQKTSSAVEIEEMQSEQREEVVEECVQIQKEEVNTITSHISTRSQRNSQKHYIMCDLLLIIY